VVITLVFVVVMALAAVDGGPGAATASGGPHSPAYVTAGGPGLGELRVPSRASLAAGLVELGSGKARPLLHAAFLSAAALLLVVLVARSGRVETGRPWHRRRHSAVLRAPPLLLQA
jgi:hypothetical protein